MMNGEVTKSIMTSSLVINAASSKSSQPEQIALLYRIIACHGLRVRRTRNSVLLHSNKDLN